MTRTMYDGINTDAGKIPTTAQLVAGYVDGLYRWSDADWARFPNSVKVRIAVFATTDDGEALDCEPGNCTPAESVDWVLMRRRAGADPTVYCNELDPVSGWPAVRAAFHARAVPEPHYWVANYPGGLTVPQIPAGAVALQYTDTGSYDLSVVADYWPGIDPPQEDPMTPDDMATLAQLIENRKVGVITSPVADQAATSLGVETASNPARWAALNARLDALTAAVKAIGTPQVDLAALEALIEQHLAAGSVPGVIAVAVAKHFGADLNAG